MAMIYLLTAPRIPQLYYGTEILKQSPKQRDDGLVRSDFPGGWAGDAVNAFTGKGLSKDSAAGTATGQNTGELSQKQHCVAARADETFQPCGWHL